MQKMDRILLLALCLFTCAAVGAAGVQSWRLRRIEQQQNPAAEPQRLNVTAKQVISDRPALFGDASCPYTLIEFADYQCPPCRAAQQALPAFLLQRKGRLRYIFRHYPLTNLHVYALPAALAAEAAREQGRFSEMHMALFQSALAPADIERLVRNLHLDRSKFNVDCKTTARRAVKNDMQAAEALHLLGTPCFLLCCPDGRVERLGSLAQIDQFLMP